MSQEHNNYKKKYNDWEINERSQNEYKHILSHFLIFDHYDTISLKSLRWHCA